MPHYKLTYYDAMGLGEPIRFMLHYMGKEFEDIRLPVIPGRSLRCDPTYPYGRVPLLEIDGRVLHQPTAILRYLAIEAGLSGNNADENLEIDMIVGAFGDITAEIRRYFRTETRTEQAKCRQTFIKEVIPFYMDKFETVLKNNGGYLANGKLSWADFYVVGFSESIHGMFGVNLIKRYPHFKEYREKIHTLPGIKEWVKRRPNLAV